MAGRFSQFSLNIAPNGFNFGTEIGEVIWKMGMNSQIDGIDRRILAALHRDGRMSMTELAATVGLSKTPCQLRVKRLRADGYYDDDKHPEEME